MLTHSAHKFYADDTVLYTSNPSDALARDQLQTDFNSLAKWCDNNLLSINIKKTKVMTFGTKQKIDKVPQLTINFKGKNIEQVNTYKYLGIHLDSSLSFKEQINEVSKLVSHKAYCLARIKKFVGTRIACHFHCSDIYVTANQHSISKLKSLQKRCLRSCIPNNIVIDSEQLFTLTGVSRLLDRSEAHLLNLMYKRAHTPRYL